VSERDGYVLAGVCLALVLLGVIMLARARRP
jgi:hypothetical protein